MVYLSTDGIELASPVFANSIDDNCCNWSGFAAYEAPAKTIARIKHVATTFLTCDTASNPANQTLVGA